MRRLILFRHGKAEATPLTGGDKARRLLDRGRADSARTARWLAEAGFRPDLVLVSPALRTQATWEAIADVFPDARSEPCDTLYMGEMDEIMDEVWASKGDADTVMVVGHNPGLQELAARLAAEAGAPEDQIERLNDGFPTSSACVAQVREARGAVLEAIYEPPRPDESAPRWVFLQPFPETGG